MEFFINQANFIHNLTYRSLTETTIHAAKRIVLDALGCMVAGSRLLTPADLPKGGNTAIGRTGKVSREWATFLNGCQLVATEMDEGNQFSKGHPLAHLLPSLLTEAEQSESTGQDFLVALVAAYEVTTRWGSAVTLRKDIHPHGNWGTLGGAAAVAKLRGGDTDLILQSMMLANSMPMSSAWAAAFTGATVRNAYIGMSNVIGLMATDMAVIGVRSNENVMKSVYQSIVGNGLQAELLDQNLGKQFFIEKNYMKLYACCRYIHGSVDVLEKLKRQGVDVRPESIDWVKVKTYHAASLLNGHEAPNALAAKFSIPVSLAIWFCKGSVDQDHFTDEIANDPWIRLIASKITVVEDPALTKLLPAQRAARVTIRLKDGTEHTDEVRSATGDYHQPLSDEQVVEKFHRLSAFFWDQKRRDRIVEGAFSLENQKDMRDFFALLSVD